MIIKFFENLFYILTTCIIRILGIILMLCILIVDSIVLFFTNIVTSNGIYYIQNGVLYYLDISGNRVKIRDGMEDCFSMHGRIVHKENQSIAELQCVFYDCISTETFAENHRKIREFMKMERLKFFSKISKGAEISNSVITLKIWTKKETIFDVM